VAQAPAQPIQASIDRIMSLVSPLGVTGEQVRDLRGAARAVATLKATYAAADVLIPGELVRLAPSVMTALENAGVPFRVPADLDDARDARLGVSIADGAIAETGSIILAESSLSDRAIGLLVLNQIVLIPVERIVPSLTEAAQIVREVALRGGYATFVTGPSRTADIEMSLTVGVQGPGTVHYIFVESMR
jgi:L-lactate dehydrogenase complex protein LldG